MDKVLLKFRTLAWGLEKAPWIRTQAALPEVGFPAHILWLTTVRYSSSRRSDTVFWPFWVLHTHDVEPYMLANTHTDNKMTQQNRIQQHWPVYCRCTCARWASTSSAIKWKCCVYSGLLWRFWASTPQGQLTAPVHTILNNTTGLHHGLHLA